MIFMVLVFEGSADKDKNLYVEIRSFKSLKTATDNLKNQLGYSIGSISCLATRRAFDARASSSSSPG